MLGINALSPGLAALGCAPGSWLMSAPYLRRIAKTYLKNFAIEEDRQYFLNLMLACPEMSDSDERAEEIGRIHGNRDGVWLRQTVPNLAAIDGPTVIAPLSPAFKKQKLPPLRAWSLAERNPSIDKFLELTFTLP